MIAFLDIEDFSVFRKVDGGVTTEIVDSFFVNLMRKWFIFQDSGDSGIEIGGVEINVGKEEYDDTLSEGFSEEMSGKPIMFTSEVIDGVEHLIAYSLDFEVEPKFLDGGAEFEVSKNPDVTNDGDGFIKKLDGGALSDSDVGLTWVILIDDGQVLDSSGDALPLKLPGPIADLAFSPIQENFPSPFLLFGKKDIS